MKVKKGNSGFQSMVESRKRFLKKGGNRLDSNDYPMNRLSSNLHPMMMSVRVKRILEETHDTKTFVLEPNYVQKQVPFFNFQAGQYITIEVPINGYIFQRPYSISCTPERRSIHEIQITIKRVEKGVVSNYFLDQVNIGDTFFIHGPFGEFVYQPIRDAHHVMAIVGGSGITPIMAMAESLADRKQDYYLTIFYGAKTKKDLIFKERLDFLAKKDPQIEVVYLLQNEALEGYLTGSVTKELILQYRKEETSYFICGPNGLYESMNEILKDLNIPNKYIRHDLYVDYEKAKTDGTFEIHVLTNGEEKIIYGRGKETVLEALEHSGISAPKHCGVGVCGFCRSKLLGGTVLTNQKYVTAADKKYKYIHPCATYPLSDITIQLPK